MSRQIFAEYIKSDGNLHIYNVKKLREDPPAICIFLFNSYEYNIDFPKKKMGGGGWPTDLSVPNSSLAGGGNLSNRKRGPNAHSFSLAPSDFHHMTKILLKWT